MAFRIKISSSGSPTYTVQGGAGILRPNAQKKIRIFAEEGQFSEMDKVEFLLFEDGADLNLKSHIRASQIEVKTLLQNFAPTSSVQMPFELQTEKKPKMQLAFPCETCEKAFAYREALLSHMKKKHKITLPHVYQCKYCDFKGAGSKRAHRAHERHHEQKALKKTAKFNCQSCEEKFDGEKQLSIHIVRAHTEHLCRHGCGEKFANKGDERTHFLNKHSKQENLSSLETPPPCKICGKQYSWFQGLQKHLRKSSCGPENEKRKARENEDKEVGGEEKDKEMENKDVDEVQPNVVAVEMDKEEVGGEEQGRAIKEKPSGQRGRKRKSSNENENESEYEKLRRKRIKEKEDFLSSLDLDV